MHRQAHEIVGEDRTTIPRAECNGNAGRAVPREMKRSFDVAGAAEDTIVYNISAGQATSQSPVIFVLGARPLILSVQEEKWDLFELQIESVDSYNESSLPYTCQQCRPYIIANLLFSARFEIRCGFEFAFW